MNREPPASSARRVWPSVVDTVQSLVVGLLLALALQVVVQPTVVFGQSMEPSIHENERLIIDKIAYRAGAPARGDIVVFSVRAEPFPLIKRVVGLPGETIEIRDGRVLVDGQELDETYASGPTLGRMPRMRIPGDSVFVMGDNRSLGGSLDSRQLGPIRVRAIVGRARLSFWPPEDWGVLDAHAAGVP